MKRGLKILCKWLAKIISSLLLGLLFVYKKVISPFLPPACRFYPTCSAYSAGCIRRFGPMKGLYLTVLRISKCHPFHPGGYDPVPGEDTPN